MGKIRKAGAVWLSAAIILGACGKSQESSTKEQQAKSEAKSGNIGANRDWNNINPNIQKETKGKMEVLYTNREAGYSQDMDGFKVKVEGYQIARVTEINNALHAFNNDNEGYVVTAVVSIDNERNHTVYYNSDFRIQLENEFEWVPSEVNTFIDDKQKLRSKKEKDLGKFAPKDNVSGLITFTLTNDEYKRATNLKPKFIIAGGAADNDGFKNSFADKAVFDFSMDEEGAKKSTSNQAFYPDRLNTGNYADRKMLFEKIDIGEKKQLEDIKVTLEGVQYTEVIPTEANKELFSDFGDSGIVAVNIRLKIENGSKTALSLFALGSTLNIDEDRGTAVASSTVEPDNSNEIAAGEKGEKYHVFLFRKDEFDLFKKLNLKFGPFYGTDGSPLFNDKSIDFSLPVPKK